MTFQVIVSPEAEEQMRELEEYIAAESYPDRAAKYLDRLASALERLGNAPFRGTSREDIGPGFRTTGFERRITILFVVEEVEVRIVGIFYAGRQP